MAEISEVFDDAKGAVGGAKGSLKKLTKSKPFLIAAGVVAIAALYVAYKASKANSSTVSTTESDYVYPQGYQGYPEVSGTGSYDDLTGTNSGDYFSTLQESLSNQLDTIRETYNSENSSLRDMITNVSDSLGDLRVSNAELQTSFEQQQQAAEKQAAIDAMKNNSELYNVLSASGASRAELDALHEQNATIAQNYGLSFDNSTGNWYDADGALYTTSQQQAQVITGKPVAQQTTIDYSKSGDLLGSIAKLATTGGTAAEINTAAEQRLAKLAAAGKDLNSSGFDEKVDYQAAINSAKAAGASDSAIQQLEAARAQKIAAKK